MQVERPNPADNLMLYKKELWIRDYSVRMQRWFSGIPQPPIRIDAELHRRCNLACIQCSRRADEEKGVRINAESRKREVPDERWVEIAKESGKLGVKAWNIAGVAEPFEKPRLTIKVMEALKGSAIFGEITTNGTLLREREIKRIVEMHWDCVNVSLDSPKAEVHDELRGGITGTFDKASETIQMLRHYRDLFGLEKPCIVVNVVLNKKNYRDLPKLVKYAGWLGADAVFVEPMMVYTERGKRLKLGMEEIRELPGFIEAANEAGRRANVTAFISCVEEDHVLEINEFRPELVEKTSEFREVIIGKSKETETDKIENRFSLVEEPDKADLARRYREMGFADRAMIDRVLAVPCFHPWFFLMITADGSVFHCGECTDHRHNIKNEALREVWFGSHMEELRRQYAEGRLPDYCDRCRPNVINDIQIVRRSILEYANVHNLQHELVKLMREKEDLRRALGVKKRRR